MYWTAILITAILLLAYSILLLRYRQWFLHLPIWQINKSIKPQTKFSVLIPARNEAENIQACLLTVLQQNYPADLFEVIVINDHSTDETEKRVRALQYSYSNLQLLNLKDLLGETQLNAYKKKAIELAIAESKGDWIVTTDADCTVTANWLLLYDNYIQLKNPAFVAAPVMFTDNLSFLGKFQLLDFISLQGITAAAVSAGYHTMCNGANIAYQKTVFYEVGQFKGIDHLASGDDMLLMYKIKQKYPNRLGYIFSRDAIVQTAPMPDWKSFLNQRIRWASKADQYQDKTIFYTLALVYAVNALLLILFFWSLLIKGGISNWLVLMAAKTLMELSLMFPVAKFYQQTKALWWFPVMQPFHLIYTVIAGWLGKFGTYQWKGRKVH